MSEVLHGFDQKISRFDIRHKKDICIAGDGAGDPLMCCRLFRDRIVQSKGACYHAAFDLSRPVHLFQLCGIPGTGHFFILFLHCAQSRDLRVFISKGMGGFHGIPDDRSLGIQIRCDIDRRIGDIKQPVKAFHFKRADMAQHTVSAQAIGFVQHSFHDDGGIHHSLHDQRNVPFSGKSCRFFTGSLPVGNIHDLPSIHPDIRFLCFFQDLLSVPDQDRGNDLPVTGKLHCFEYRRVRCAGNRHFKRRPALCCLY